MSSAPEPRPPLRRGLGRGLDVLIGGAGQVDLAHVPVEAIHPNPRQPRRRLEKAASTGLVESIRRQGVVQPVVVRPRPSGGWELIAGERRWRAARQAGLATVPAVVRHADDRDSLLLAVVENVAREQLSPVEEARAYAALVDELDVPLSEVAERVGRSKSSVSNRLRLLELPEDVLGLLEEGKLTEGHARAVLAVPDQEGRRRLARLVVRRGLSVRAAERAARQAGARRRRRPQAPHPALVERVHRSVRRLTGREARVSSGRVEIPFADDHELAELAEALERACASLEVWAILDSNQGPPPYQSGALTD